MIDYVVGGEYLNVTSNKGAQPYINMSNTQPMVGAMAFDSSSQTMKVYDGNSWLTIGGGTATVSLNANAISILQWAEQKMREEASLKALADKHPTIKSLIDEMNASVFDYQRKIDMVKTLIESPGDNGIKPSMVP
jgi:hypothetical protein